MRPFWFSVVWLWIVGPVFGATMRLTWPTPSTAYLDGQPFEVFVQPTASGTPRSGLYGCVRNGGTRFHEGLDLAPVGRNAQGEAVDPIVVVADGIVRHVSSRPSDGGYGRYVVVEHPDLVPAVYTLYAHLAAITPGLSVGDRVNRGDRLGIMGRSAGGYSIPKDRAHLHFEMGVRFTDSFSRWYSAQGYGSPNNHGVFNGMNLVGFDPLAFFDAFKNGRASQPIDFMATLPVAVTVRVNDRRIPDFARRYPMLVEGEVPVNGPAGWEIDFHGSRLPLRLKPLSVAAPGSRFEIVRSDAGELSAWTCRSLVARSGKRRIEVPGKDLVSALELLFGPGR
jgi:murein DD-endopeptidase MepM/ murein hydrolase activator NlpD